MVDSRLWNVFFVGVRYAVICAAAAMVFSVAGMPCGADDAVMRNGMVWKTLPDMPEPLGVGGPYAGISNNVLIVAGGAHFPVSLFDGGVKRWIDTMHVLSCDGDDCRWENGFRLPRPLAYGASVTLPEGVLCIGGCDAERCYDDVFLLTYANGDVVTTPLSPLPEPSANHAAVLLDGVVYVVGGQTSLAGKTALRRVLRYDITESAPVWRETAPLPGPGRILPVAGAQHGAVYVFSGCELLESEDGSVGRRYLDDAYRYDPVRETWARIADLPRPAAAAPTPAFPLGNGHLAVYGGDTGVHADRVFELKDRHPGFSAASLIYNTITDTWATGQLMPYAPVTTVCFSWNDAAVIPSGEVRPGVRAPSVLTGQPQSNRTPFSLLDYGALVFYLSMLIVIGCIMAGQEKGTNDFFLAGRRIPWWAAGVSIFGTQLSAITFMAIPAKSYASDWSFSIINIGIVAVAPIIIAFYLPFFRRLEVTTAYEYFEKRFNYMVRLVGSLTFILFQLGRMGIVLYLPAIALSTVTGFNVFLSITVMGVLATAYTVLGGIEAVIWTDVLQVVVLLGGAALSLVIMILNSGAPGDFFSAAYAAGKLHVIDWNFDLTAPVIWVLLLGWGSNLISYSSDQTVIQRYLTTRDERTAARSIWTNAILCIPATILFFSVGTALFVFYGHQPALLNPHLATDAVFPWFIVSELPAGIAGIVIAGLFAAAMSTLDSSLNSIATAVTTDIVRRFNTGLSDHGGLKLARWLTVVFGLFGTSSALLMATMDISSLFDQYLKVIGLLGGGLAGLFILGIFTQRATSLGSLVGFTGSAVVQCFVQSRTSLHFLVYPVTGIFSCVIIGWIASILLPGTAKSQQGLTYRTLMKE